MSLRTTYCFFLTVFLPYFVCVELLADDLAAFTLRLYSSCVFMCFNCTLCQMVDEFLFINPRYRIQRRYLIGVVKVYEYKLQLNRQNLFEYFSHGFKRIFLRDSSDLSLLKELHTQIFISKISLSLTLNCESIYSHSNKVYCVKKSHIIHHHRSSNFI